MKVCVNNNFMENSILSLDNADIYQRDNLVLSKVNLTINKGDFYYLIGKTGSGKSSLMKNFIWRFKITKRCWFYRWI